MKRAIPHALVALVSITLASCASSRARSDAGGVTSEPAGGAAAAVTLTRVGEAVQLTENAESTHQCEFVAHLSLPSRSASDVNAIRELRNEAGRRGANLVLLVMENRTTIARAEGYLCAD